MDRKKGNVSQVILCLATVLTVCAGSFLALPSAAASAYQDWSGYWITNYGKMQLLQNGNAVNGAVAADNGPRCVLDARLADEWGFSLQGRYGEGTYLGAFAMKMNKDGASFEGWMNSPTSVWFGKRAPEEFSESRMQAMDVLNNSPYAITALFVCSAGSEEWQEVLDGRELLAGQQRKVLFPLNGHAARWDIKVVDSRGRFTVFPRQEIKDDYSSIDYYHRDGQGQIGFGVG